MKNCAYPKPRINWIFALLILFPIVTGAFTYLSNNFGLGILMGVAVVSVYINSKQMARRRFPPE